LSDDLYFGVDIGVVGGVAVLTAQCALLGVYDTPVMQDGPALAAVLSTLRSYPNC